VRVAVRRGGQPDDSAFTCEIVLGKGPVKLDECGDRLMAVVDLNGLAQEVGEEHLRRRLPDFTAKLREFLCTDESYMMCAQLEELLIVMWLARRESGLSGCCGKCHK
jgi:hypothetical protein